MDFERFWELYTDNFPPDERRNRKDQLKLMENPLYKVEPMMHGEDEVGFFAYWTLDGFDYVEHMAVDDAYKGKGVGSAFLSDFARRHGRVVLEIVPPEDELSARRKKFYERLGFVANPYPYVMPKLSEEGNPLPLIVMSYPEMLDPEEFERVRKELYRVVYQVKE